MVLYWTVDSRYMIKVFCRYITVHYILNVSFYCRYMTLYVTAENCGVREKKRGEA